MSIFLEVVKKAFTKQILPKLFCFERYSVVENMPEKKYWDKVDTHENGLGMGCLMGIPSIFFFFFVSFSEEMVLFSVHQVLHLIFLKTTCYSLLRPIFPSHSHFGFNFILSSIVSECSVYCIGSWWKNILSGQLAFQETGPTFNENTLRFCFPFLYVTQWYFSLAETFLEAQALFLSMLPVARTSQCHVPSSQKGVLSKTSDHVEEK